MLFETNKTIKKWHKKTFPDATLTGQLEKFKEERLEFETETDTKKKMLELADMYIVICGIGRFDMLIAVALWEDIKSLLLSNFPMYSPPERIVRLRAAINKKMRINRQRTWNKLNGQYKHKA